MTILLGMLTSDQIQLWIPKQYQIIDKQRRVCHLWDTWIYRRLQSIFNVVWNWKYIAPSPTPRCSIYWKGSFQVTHDYDCQLYYSVLYNELYRWVVLCCVVSERIEFIWLGLTIVRVSSACDVDFSRSQLQS